MLRTPSPTDAAREARVRRAVARVGYSLVKSRRRDWLAGTFGVIDPYLNAWVLHTGNGYGYDLDEIEEWLSEMSRS